MAGEYDDSNETLKNSSPPPIQGSFLTLQKAIEFGDYEPEHLATFPEWHSLSRSAQYQLVKQAIDNRLRQLIEQWAEINNVLDFRNKPHLQEALDKIMDQRRKVLDDKERLMIEFT